MTKRPHYTILNQYCKWIYRYFSRYFSVFSVRRIGSVCAVFFCAVLLTACPPDPPKPKMVSFQFEPDNNAFLELTGSISGSLITVEIPSEKLEAFKAAFHSLIPSFTAENGEVTVDGLEQVSGRTAPQDFTGPVFYDVTDSKGQTQRYEVGFKSGNLAYIPDVLQNFSIRFNL